MTILFWILVGLNVAVWGTAIGLCIYANIKLDKEFKQLKKERTK